MADSRRTSGSKPPPPGKPGNQARHLEQFVVEEIELGGDIQVGPQTKRGTARVISRWRPVLRLAAGTISLALLVVAAALATRSVWPTDETRLLASAWEMWSQHNWLVPQFNGAPVPVAPLFLWLVQLGWLAFGVSEWWPRLLPALAMIASLFVVARIAALLWPGDEPWWRRVPLVLLGGFYWLASATFLTSDFLTVLFTLLAVHALLWMWRARDQRVWLLLSLELGLGLLASGSLILLYVLPVAILAPLWTRGTPTMPWKYWYVDIIKAVLAGMAMLAAWLVPAAGRVPFASLAPVLSQPFATHALDLYAGARPWWWLLALLPVLAFPWSLWPLPLLRLWHIRREPISNGLAFCLVWATASIAVFLLSPVRQPQLLLPLVPAFFLVVAWLVLDERHADHDHSRRVSTMIFPLMLLGALLAVLPKLPRVEALPDFLWQLSPLVGVAVIVVGVAVGWLPIPALEKRATNMTATVSVLTTLALLALGWQFNDRYDIRTIAARVAEVQQQGQPVAVVAPYAGELHFAGGLVRPLDIVATGDVGLWIAAHPQGLIVADVARWQPAVADVQPLQTQNYADSHLALWSVAALQAAASAVPGSQPPTPSAP